MWRPGAKPAGAHGAARPDIDLHPAVTAHAGSLDTPPNTLRSFQAALAYPVDYLEADVRFTPEGTAYLSHDPLPLPRQATAMSLAELLQVAARHPPVGLNLDMKEFTGLPAMKDLVRRAGMGSRVLLTGVSADMVARVRDGADGLPYLLNARPSFRQRFLASGIAAFVRQVRDCGARGLNVNHAFVTRRLARALRAAGLQVSVWTVDAAREMRRVLGLPVDNVTTNRIDRLLALRGGGAR